MVFVKYEYDVDCLTSPTFTLTFDDMDYVFNACDKYDLVLRSVSLHQVMGYGAILKQSGELNIIT